MDRARDQDLRRPEAEPASGPAPAPAPPQARVLDLQRSYGNAAVGRWLARATAELEQTVPSKDASARFEGDPDLAKIEAGSETLARGARGLAVTKLQQALVDAGYPLARFGVDGKFEGETETTLKKFQHDATVPETGVLDQPTLAALNAKYDTRQPYIDNAKLDPLAPGRGTRTLTAGERAAVQNALVPQRGTGGSPSTFTEDVGGQKYGDRIRDRLKDLIDKLHKELFADKEPLRADPAKNFHAWSVLEGTAAASKDVTDALYGSYATGPAMSAAAGNFVDQWEDEIARNAALGDPDKEAKAREKVWYLINSNCETINEDHGAVPSDAAESAILTPIVETFVNTKPKVQKLLELDIGWEGAQLEGVVYLQRFKQATDAGNREQLWQLFHVCIHEYLHSLAHSDYKAYASRQDKTRYNTLIEGFCDFFTENVRKTVTVDDALRRKVEGPYYDAAAPVPAVSVGVYPSIEQAEQVVSIVGIRNAQAAYFRGEVDKIGGP